MILTNKLYLQDVTNKSPSKQQFSNKLPSGIEYDDIRIGNGLPAKKGKLVSGISLPLDLVNVLVII